MVMAHPDGRVSSTIGRNMNNETEQNTEAAVSIETVDIRQDPVRLSTVLALSQGYMSNPQTNLSKSLPYDQLIDQADALLDKFRERCVREAVEKFKRDAEAQGAEVVEIEVDTQGNPAIDASHAGDVGGHDDGDDKARNWGDADDEAEDTPADGTIRPAGEPTEPNPVKGADDPADALSDSPPKPDYPNGKHPIDPHNGGAGPQTAKASANVLRGTSEGVGAAETPSKPSPAETSDTTPDHSGGPDAAKNTAQTAENAAG